MTAYNAATGYNAAILYNGAVVAEPAPATHAGPAPVRIALRRDRALLHLELAATGTAGWVTHTIPAVATATLATHTESAVHATDRPVSMHARIRTADTAFAAAAHTIRAGFDARTTGSTVHTDDDDDLLAAATFLLEVTR